MRRGIVWLFPGLLLLAGCASRSPGLGGAPGGDGGPKGGEGASVYTSAARIIVEPSDDASALVAAISGARTSVHMTMYLFDNAAAIAALEAQRRAGHDVKVVLNQNFVDDDGSNARVRGELEQAGIDVVWAPSAFTLTHEKCVILDGQEAWIMTMNLDETSATKNREYLAVDTEPADVQEAETIFEADFAGHPAIVSGRLVVAPVNARAKLIALIEAARSTLDVEGEELSDDGIVSALTKAFGAGVHVRVVLSDAAPSAAQTNAVTLLTAAGIPVVTVSHPYIHAKAIVVDGMAAYIGSENFTAGSLDDNRELGLLFDDPIEAQKVDTTL